MPPKATVLIPTHNHGLTLRYSVRSAMQQSVDDLEIFIVGDGAADVTRRIVEELQREDSRIRFFDNPKGPRHGELHRHAALQEATGRIVCYLSDDDVWLPWHVDAMHQLLEHADFAHGLKVSAERDGGWKIKTPLFGAILRDKPGCNPEAEGVGCGLSQTAHTLEIYRSLPYGWRTAPTDAPTDRHMWRQILAQPGRRFVLGVLPTSFSLSSTVRRDMTMQQRADELEVWSGRVASPEWREQFLLLAHEFVAREAGRLIAAETKKSSSGKARLKKLRAKAEKNKQKNLKLKQEVKSNSADAATPSGGGDRRVRLLFNWLKRPWIRRAS